MYRSGQWREQPAIPLAMMRGGAMLLVAAAPLTAAFGIVGYPSSVKVWSYPANTIDDAGLGRGLAYVIDHDVCPSLLPNFVENQRGYWTIDCTMVKDTIHRAFGTWGANSHSVSFYDNTPPSYESSSTRFSEIYVTTSTSQTEPVTVTLTTSPTAPRSTGSTSGITLDMNNTMTITKAVITLAAKPVTAWYLDTGICDGVMRHESDIVSFAAFVVAVFVIVGLAIFCFLLLIQCIDLKNRNLLCAFTGYCRALFGIFTYPFTLTLVIFLLVFPGYIYAGILRPCVDDYPIEAAMLNAIGGSLGIADLSVTGTDLAMKTTGTFPEVCGSAETLLDRVQPAAADFVPCDYAPEGTPGGEWWKCDMAVRRASVMLPANPARTLTQLTL